MTQNPQDQNNPIARKFLIGLGVLLFLLGALTFGFKKFLEYSGAREWEKTRAMLIREGVELDLEKLLPEVPPDSENFAATPMIATLLWNYSGPEQKITLNDRFREMRILRRTSVDLSEQRTGLPDRLSQRETDFEEIARALVEAGDFPSDDSIPPISAIQNWMEQFRPEIAELDKASLRPFAVWPEPPLFNPFFYQEELNDYTEDLRTHHRFQGVRALAAVATENEQEALSSLRTMFQISRTLSSQPSLIPQLSSFGCDELALSVIWEGIKKGNWSADALTQISDFLSSYPADSLERLEKTMNLELITSGIRFYDHMETLSYWERHRTVTEMQIMVGANKLPYFAIFALSPKGFLDHNKSFACMLHYEVGIRPARLRDLNSSRMDTETALHDISMSNYFPRTLMMIHSDFTNRFYRQVTIVDMGKAAVALERFQKSEGHYPEDLIELVPRYLTEVPVDLQAKEKGRPLSYRIENGRPLIYSVGKNQTDEGGEIVWREYSAEKSADRRKGDWVWEYSQPYPEKNNFP